MSGRKGWVNETTGFNKFVRNKFEHLRFLQMARRVEGRKPGIVPPLPPDIVTKPLIVQGLFYLIVFLMYGLAVKNVFFYLLQVNY